MDSALIESLVEDFRRMGLLAGVPVQPDDLAVEFCPAPHMRPKRLPAGMAAVYIFAKGDEVLKVGKVGPRSQARYTSQHYNALSAKSTLARSLLGDRPFLDQCAWESGMPLGNWIMSNLSRTNILADQRLGMPVVALLEAFLQCRLNPRYEGFASQRLDVVGLPESS